MRHLFFTFLLVFSACASAGRLNNISLGMNKAEVIKEMGYPESTRANDNEEVLTYKLWTQITPGMHGYAEYWVVLVNGSVKMYGKAGDFGTAQNPSNTLNLNVNHEPASQ